MSEKVCQELPRRPSCPPPKSENRPWSRPRPPQEPSRSRPRAPRERLQRPSAAQEGAKSLPEPPVGRPGGHFGTFSAPFRPLLEPFGHNCRALSRPLALRLVLAFVSVLLLAFYSLRCFWCVLFGFLVRYFLVPRPAPKKTATQRANARATLQRRSPDLGRRDSRRVYNIYREI